MPVFPVETPAVANGPEKFPDIELTEDSEILGCDSWCRAPI